MKQILDQLSFKRVSKLKRLRYDDGREFFVLNIPAGVSDMSAAMGSVCDWNKVVTFNVEYNGKHPSDAVRIAPGEAIRIPVDAFKTDSLTYKDEVWFAEVDLAGLDKARVLSAICKPDFDMRIVDVFSASRKGRLTSPGLQCFRSFVWRGAL